MEKENKKTRVRGGSRGVKRSYLIFHLVEDAYNGKGGDSRVSDWRFWEFDGPLADCFTLEAISELAKYYNSLNSAEKCQFKDSKLLKEMARRQPICIQGILKTLSEIRKYYLLEANVRPPKKYLKWLRWLNRKNPSRKYIAAYWILRHFEALPPENRPNNLEFFITKVREQREKSLRNVNAEEDYSTTIDVYGDRRHRDPLPTGEAGGDLFPS
ncbi:MAG: hypothetical protein PHD51_01490 [Patescibacteria group bacterium]|nr:hypothetical protein [Patescibacteria group bacterium]MDD5490465.1 hypothetical protein [Patescibacteria group bacterium]